MKADRGAVPMSCETPKSAMWGVRGGDGSTFIAISAGDLARYAAWLCANRERRAAVP